MLRKVKKLFRVFNNNILMSQEEIKKIGVSIGDDCEIYDDVNFGSEPYLVSIGNHVRITRGVKFVTHDGGVWVLRKAYNMPEIDLFRPITVGDNVHIGMNAIIMPGVSIGNNVIIGCGAVVTKPIPDGEIWGGIPARKLLSVEEYYNKHLSDFDSTKHMTPMQKESYLCGKFNKG
jgi:acetyltransferase-like isoleucine patch superfamily enzyme